MSHPLGALALVLTLACGCARTDAPPEIGEVQPLAHTPDTFDLDAVLVIDPRTVVFRVEALAAERADFMMSILPPGPYWQPAESGIESGRRLLRDHLDEEAQEYPVLQFIGYILEERAVIQIRALNAECTKRYDHWGRRPAELLHSGGCVFTVDFDSATKEILKTGWGTVGPA